MSEREGRPSSPSTAVDLGDKVHLAVGICRRAPAAEAHPRARCNCWCKLPQVPRTQSYQRAPNTMAYYLARIRAAAQPARQGCHALVGCLMPKPLGDLPRFLRSPALVYVPISCPSRQITLYQDAARSAAGRGRRPCSRINARGSSRTADIVDQQDQVPGNQHCASWVARPLRRPEPGWKAR